MRRANLVTQPLPGGALRPLAPVAAAVPKTTCCSLMIGSGGETSSAAVAVAVSDLSCMSDLSRIEGIREPHLGVVRTRVDPIARILRARRLVAHAYSTTCFSRVRSEVRMRSAADPRGIGLATSAKSSNRRKMGSSRVDRQHRSCAIRGDAPGVGLPAGGVRGGPLTSATPTAHHSTTLNAEAVTRFRRVFARAADWKHGSHKRMSSPLLATRVDLDFLLCVAAVTV